jgi:hypothetical protein
MRTLGLVCLLLSLLLISGCGNVFVQGFFNPNTQTASGLVSFVEFTIIIDHNVQTQVTIVTLQNTFGNSNFTFCGDQQNQFPLNNFVDATFNFGQPCSNLLNVIIKVN